jgi:hypothetical protein
MIHIAFCGVQNGDCEISLKNSVNTVELGYNEIEETE